MRIFCSARLVTSFAATALAFAPAHAGPIDQPQYQIETFGQWNSLKPIPLYTISAHRDVIEPAEADPAYAAYTNNELIDRLPLAGTERWRDDSGARQTDPFAAEWQRRIYLGEFFAEELQRAADRCRIVFVAPQCVEGEMYYARVRSPLWLAAHDIDVFITGVEVEGAPVKSSEVKLSPEAWDSNHDQAVRALGVLPKGTTAVTVRVRVATIQHTRSTNAPKPFGWVHDFTVPVQMLDASKPRGVNAPEITREVQECLPLRGSVAMRGDTPSLRLKYDGNRSQDGIVQTGELARTMVAARVEVLRDGVVIHMAGMHDANEIDFNQDPAASLEGEVAHAVLDPEQWGRYTLRVTGDHPGYLSMWHRTQYWTGTYTVPLTDVLKPAE